MSKRELVETITTTRGDLYYRQLMRLTVRELEERIADRTMARWQRRASAERAYAAQMERQGNDEAALEALYRMDQELVERAN